MGVSSDNIYRTLTGVGMTFVLTAFAWIFFRAGDLTQALFVIERIFTQWGDGAFSYLTCTDYCAFYEIGIGRTMLAIAAVSTALMFLYELSAELRISLPRMWYLRIVRWPLYYAFILWMLFAGNFAPMTFIYFQF